MRCLSRRVSHLVHEHTPSDEELRVFLNERGQTFKRVMPLAMRNLAIAQQRDVERYRHVRGHGWDRPKASFSPGDYVLLKQEKDHSLQPPAYPHVLRILEIRPTGIVILEGSDAARCSRQLKDVAHCPLPILDTRLYPGRYYRKFVLHFSSIAFPLNALLKKDRPWEWGAVQQTAFVELKEQLCSAAVLHLPDAYRPFILTTDWS